MQNPSHILITGASSGLGAALALVYAKAGVRLSLGGRNAERLNYIAGQAKALGAEVRRACLDVTDKSAMANWLAEADSWTELDLVIANAGIAANSSTSDVATSTRQCLFDTNWQGTLNTIDPVLPKFMARRRGQIALMSSLASFRGFPKAGAYAASKGAVRLYGESLRAEAALAGVEVNVICPGFVRTPLTDKNNFRMPFLISSDQAARIIKSGLAADKPQLIFPWQMRGILALANLAPRDWLDGVIVGLPDKSVGTD